MNFEKSAGFKKKLSYSQFSDRKDAKGQNNFLNSTHFNMLKQVQTRYNKLEQLKW